MHDVVDRLLCMKLLQLEGRELQEREGECNYRRENRSWISFMVITSAKEQSRLKLHPSIALSSVINLRERIESSRKPRRMRTFFMSFVRQKLSGSNYNRDEDINFVHVLLLGSPNGLLLSLVFVCMCREPERYNQAKYFGMRFPFQFTFTPRPKALSRH